MTLLSDLRYALRLMRRNAGFTGIALLALALGIGANTAIFSAFDAILIRPLSFKEPDRLTMVWEDASHIGFPTNNLSPANWADIRQRTRVFTDITATFTARANLTGDVAPELVLGLGVAANFFEVLGVPPAQGRAFTAEEDHGRSAVVVISHNLWQRRYAGDLNILGSPILMDGRKYVVLGVMPQGFTFFRREFDFWRPASFSSEVLATRDSHYLICVARLKPGVTLAQARADVNGVIAQLKKEFPNVGARAGVLVPVSEHVAGDARITLIVLLSASGAVLLLACANLASLLVARALGRTREVAVRTALGAGRGRLLRQMITESVFITTLGGVLGLVVAQWAKVILERTIPEGVAFQTLQLDWRVVTVAAGLSLLTGVVFGVLPAFWTLYVPLNEALKQGSRSSTSTGGKLLGNVLIVAEVAASLVLLVGAALMIQTLAKLYAADLGFRPEKLLTVMTVPSAARYSDGAARNLFYQRILDKVKSIPGVQGAAYTNLLPFLSRGNTVGYRVPGHATSDDVMYRVGTSEYLPLIGAKLRYGRFFNERDRADSQPVIIINTTMAQRFWPNHNPVGEKIQVAEDWRTIVGVVEDVHERGFDVVMKHGAYVPAAQESRRMTPVFLAVRAAVESASILGAVRQAVWSVDREQPVHNVRTMDQIVDAQVANRSLQRTLLTVFAALALFIASVGLYGVLSYRVTNRTREIGLRMALGATTSNIGRMVLGQGALLIAAGLFVGFVVSIGVASALRTQFFGVAPTDPATYIGVSVLLAAIALLACYLPARRAARVDPMIALRDE